MDSSALALLRQCARITASPNEYERLKDAAGRFDAWADLPSLAEAHGLGPLTYFHLMRAGVAIPLGARQQLFASARRHQDANRVRFRVLAEILDAFAEARIQCVVLKGAALAHLIYPAPELRPISDIDLLVDTAHSRDAQTILGALAFVAPSSPASRALVSHHHLSAALKQCEGHLVQVEIHTNALARDTGSLSMSELTAPLQVFPVEGRTAYALGHADMLLHLCRHTAERASLLRMIWIVDVIGYATRHAGVIRWAELDRQVPFVTNALSLFHLVTPLTDELLTHIRPARGEQLQGIGVACKPLSEIVRGGRPLGTMARELFDPSDWWLRLHYGVNEASSLGWQRWVQHPARITYWLARRIVTHVRWYARRTFRAPARV